MGDSALLVQWGNIIRLETNRAVHALAASIGSQNIVGVEDIVVAYSSLLVQYNVSLIHVAIQPPITVYDWMREHVQQCINSLQNVATQVGNLVEIPVCYDTVLENDLSIIEQTVNLSAEEIEQIHTASVYDVYMPGFLPGFAYMGMLDERISMPRKNKPVNTKPGAVAIAGLQTGIYPIQSPGGWHVVGYTPLQMFNATHTPPARLQAGDRVRFKAISTEEYHQLKQQPA